jgi:hypothetical protein
MKKIVFIFSVILSLSMNCNAQENKTIATTKAETARVADKAKAQEDIKDLESFLTLSHEKSSLLLGLFTTKHGMIRQGQAESAEQKTKLNEIITRKMEGLFDIPTFEKLKSNTVLYQKLIN